LPRHFGVTRPDIAQKIRVPAALGKALFASAHENEFEVREVMPEAFANDLKPKLLTYKARLILNYA
jgi:hypothetical protein